MNALILDLGAYVDAFMANVAWASVYQRYQDAVHATSEPFGATQEDVGSSLVFDVRRAGVFDKAPSMIPGARWCDPATVGQWASELPANPLPPRKRPHDHGHATTTRQERS